MKLNNNQRNGIIGIIVLMVLIVVFYFRKANLRQEPRKYVVGVVLKVRKPSSGDFVAEFEYNIGGKSYEGYSNLGQFYDKVHKYEKYMVSVPIGHEDLGSMVFECKMKDEESPPEGWDSPPSSCPNLQQPASSPRGEDA